MSVFSPLHLSRALVCACAMAGFAEFADELKQHEGDAQFDNLSAALKKVMKESTTPAPPAQEEEGSEDDE
jgi:hypothetical protein